MFPIKNISMRVLHTFQMGTARCHSSAVKICWWVRWHCPLNTGFDIWALAIWGRARYLSVTKGTPKYWSFTSELVFKCSFCSFICGCYDVSLSKWPVIQHLIVFYVINPYPAEWNYLNFQPFEVVPRYRDPQPQVVENYSYLFQFDKKNYKSWYLHNHFIPNNSCLIGW